MGNEVFSTSRDYLSGNAPSLETMRPIKLIARSAFNKALVTEPSVTVSKRHMSVALPNRFRRFGMAVLLGIALCSLKLNGADQPSTAQRRPVLVELFTSEGCSSCPPADALLAQLDAKQFVEGADAIVLSEHVTYWNHDGWTDPFSSDTATDRQKEYVDRFKLESAYTPEAVIDGAAEVLGSDSAALRRAVAHAAIATKAELRIDALQLSGNDLHFAVHAAQPLHGRMTLVLADDAAQSSVKQGENAGRKLEHVAVVRVMKTVGAEAADGRPLELKLPTDPRLQGPKLRLVVFISDKSSGRVLAVNEQSIAR